MRLGSARSKEALEAELATLPGWTQQPDKMAVNGYGCQACTRWFLVVHVDRGTTPPRMGCKYEGCDGWANSFGYPSAPIPHGLWKEVLVFEWYRPETDALGRFHEDQMVDEYIRQGGLLLRERVTK